MAELSFHRYGKSKVRIVKVSRGKEKHEMKELTVMVLLDGDITAAYLKGDNSTTVPTDTINNTCYVLAKKHSVDPIERFGMHICDHFLTKYAHMTSVHVEVSEHCWERAVSADSKTAFPTSFVKREPELRSATVIQRRGGRPAITCFLSNLTVLKTTDSSFVGFHRDEYTTLQERSDRMFCTSVKADWTYHTLPNDFNAAYKAIRGAIIDTFASKVSLSVQQTIYDSGEEALKRVPQLQSIHFVMPNIHLFHFDLARFGLNNADEVYYPTDAPSGYIEGTIARKAAKL